MLRDEMDSRRFANFQRTLTDIGSKVHGLQSFQADQISDLADQLDEVRQENVELRDELKRVAERQDKIADFVKERLKA